MAVLAEHAAVVERGLLRAVTGRSRKGCSRPEGPDRCGEDAFE